MSGLNGSDPFAPYLARAVAHYRAGQMHQAEAICRAIVTLEARHADGLSLLGVVLDSQGDLDGAVVALKAALAVKPAPAYHTNLGRTLLKLHRPEDALVHHKAAVALRPTYPEGLNNLGVTLDMLGRFEEAIDAYRRAIVARPDFADAYGNLGNALRQVGRFAEATQAYERAVALHPASPAHLTGLGHTLRADGRPDAAAEVFRRGLALTPDDPDALNNLGVALGEAGQASAAVSTLSGVAAQTPAQPEAHFNLGHALRQSGRMDEAIAALQRAIALRPDYAEAHSNLGNVLREAGRLDEALAALRRAIDVRPDYAEGYLNYAIGLHDLGRLDESLAATRKALELRPEDPEAWHHLGMLHLLRGEFEPGWKAYEWRFRTQQARAYTRHFAQPQWDGEDIAGRTILLHAEQGHGDTMQFVRYAPMVAARGARVMLEVQPPLKRLMGSVEGVAQVLAAGEGVPAFDMHCPLLSLPRAFGTLVGTVPAHVPYLAADPASVAAWRLRLAALPGLKVGLVWAGGARPHQAHLAIIDRRRSMRLAQFAPLAAVEGVSFVSLQKGPPAAEAAGGGGLGLHDWTEELTDFADTAALVQALDLVISVDTAVCHLAGALGRPVWMLNRFAPCWRWMGQRDDTPWYPTLRQFRQEQPDEWSPVMARVVRALAAELADDGLANARARIDASGGVVARTSALGQGRNQDRENVRQ